MDYIPPETKEAAAKLHKKQHTLLSANADNIICYSDGSMLSHQVGAGVFIAGQHTRRPPPTELAIPMGTQMEVYDAELHGVLQAAEKCRQFLARQQDKKAWIFTDNQAAVQRIASLTAAPGQEVALQLADIADTLHERNNSLHIQWVPGHVDVEGNERADKLAKEATQKTPPPRVKTSLSYLRRVVKAKRNTEWREVWTAMPNKGRNYTGTFRSKPDAIFLTNKRQLVATVTQIRTNVGYLLPQLSSGPTQQRYRSPLLQLPAKGPPNSPTSAHRMPPLL
jgi:ribonuclease HI